MTRVPCHVSFDKTAKPSQQRSCHRTLCRRYAAISNGVALPGVMLRSPPSVSVSPLRGIWAGRACRDWLIGLVERTGETAALPPFIRHSSLIIRHSSLAQSRPTSQLAALPSFIRHSSFVIAASGGLLLSFPASPLNTPNPLNTLDPSMDPCYYASRVREAWLVLLRAMGVTQALFGCVNSSLRVGEMRFEMKDKVETVRKILTGLGVVISGVGLATAFPPFDQTINSWSCLVPLLWIIRSAPRKRAVWCAFFTGVIFWLVSLCWLPAIIKNGGPWALVVLGMVGLILRSAITLKEG